MKRTIVLKAPSHYRELIEALDKIKGEGIHEVEIRPYRKNVSSNQRALYFEWIKVISVSTGDTKEDVHMRLKRKYLVPIFTREKDWYREMIESVRHVYRLGEESVANKLYDSIMLMTSITDATTSEMCEYMDDIRMAVWDKMQISLPVPDDPQSWVPEGWVAPRDKEAEPC